MSRTGTEHTAPKAVREQLKLDLSHVTAGVVGRSESASKLAVDVGVSRALLRSWADAENDSQIGVADAACMPLAEQRMPFAEFIAGPGYMMAALPVAESSRAGIELHVRVLTETTQAVTAHAVAIADGRVDRREGAELEREIDEAIRALLTMRECARQAQREGVVGCDVISIKAAAR